MNPLLQKQQELKQRLDQRRQLHADAKARLTLAEENLKKCIEAIKAEGIEPEQLNAKIATLETEIKQAQSELEQQLNKLSPMDAITNRGLQTH